MGCERRPPRLGRSTRRTAAPSDRKDRTVRATVFAASYGDRYGERFQRAWCDALAGDRQNSFGLDSRWYVKLYRFPDAQSGEVCRREPIGGDGGALELSVAVLRARTKRPHRKKSSRSIIGTSTH